MQQKIAFVIHLG